MTRNGHALDIFFVYEIRASSKLLAETYRDVCSSISMSFPLFYVKNWNCALHPCFCHKHVIRACAFYIEVHIDPVHLPLQNNLFSEYHGLYNEFTVRGLISHTFQ